MRHWAWVLLCVSTCAGQQISVPAVTKQYCSGCHNPGVKAGGLTLDAERVLDHPADWEKAVKKLRARHMPPPGLPHPDNPTYDSLISSLEATLDRQTPDPGRTDTFRRLSRTEYRNAIRDLLAVDVDVTSLLPAELSLHTGESSWPARLTE